MFTGLVECIGTLASIEPDQEGACVRITFPDTAEGFSTITGESIAVNGICLTVASPGAGYFDCHLLSETLARTSLADPVVGRKLNLERAMPPSGRFGGHFVTGHVDGVGHVSRIEELGRDRRIFISCPEDLCSGIVMKGCIAVDGVSLTVTSLSDNAFSVDIIPHTARATTLGGVQTGTAVNLETDILGKYVRRYMPQA